MAQHTRHPAFLTHSFGRRCPDLSDASRVMVHFSDKNKKYRKITFDILKQSEGKYNRLDGKQSKVYKLKIQSIVCIIH